MTARIAAVALCLALGSCAHRGKPPLEDLSGRRSLSLFNIQSVHGVRDGDKLVVQVLVSDSSSLLNVDLHFAIGSPTTLQSGAWSWSLPNGLIQGTVAARSITFLGGQDDGPSIGGVFDLIAPTYPTYRLNLPLTVLPRAIVPRNSQAH